MAWGQIIIAFIVGSFLGPMLIAMFQGKKNANAAA